MAEATSGTAPGERGYRRMRLAAMAGNLYRTGQQTINDVREQYAQTMAPVGTGGDGHGRTSIPGAFPDVEIHVQGNDQMVLFPSYAIWHVKRDWDLEARQRQQQQGDRSSDSDDDGDYWRQEWERHEDERAVVDVDVRGWIYSPQMGPMTRRNRMLIGLARQLSGIPAPRAEATTGSGSGADGSSEGGGQMGFRAQHQMHEAQREQERIEREAAQIERRGREEERVAFRGGYSERPGDGSSAGAGLGVAASRTTTQQSSRSASRSGPPSPTQTGELSDAELTVANANLMARIAPFMTTPLEALPITVFFYNETQSRSRTVTTNDAGHFNLRAPLDFVPTHVRVLATPSLSAVRPVAVVDPRGVSVISDVDDTVKRSNISGGAKEIFRNTFVRDLADLTVPGVADWYNRMHSMGVGFHYCSNSPWQLYPVLGSFFKSAGLPAGSLHLKQYSGMLQGIFEPVAERKKSTLDRLLRDFPQRDFILVGDSGEADLEVYTDLALANPGRILAVFIRDVTTPEQTPFFDSSFGLGSGPSGQGSSAAIPRKMSSLTLNESRRPPAPPPKQAGPVMGDLIDLSEEPTSAPAAAIQRKPPPPRPSKPAALRSAPSLVGAGKQPDSPPAPPLPERRPNLPTRNSSPPPPPPPRRRTGGWTANGDVDEQPLPPPALGQVRGGGGAGRKWSSTDSPTASPALAAQGGGTVDRKVELWMRRLTRAHEQLDGRGVLLYTWRTGDDVVEEAVGLISRAQARGGRAGRGGR